MIAGLKLPDREPPDRDRRVSLVLAAATVAALDELARYHRVDRRSEAVGILVAAVDRNLALLHTAAAPVTDGEPRSVQARRRAAAGAALRGSGGAR